MTFHNHFMTGLANKEFDDEAHPHLLLYWKYSAGPYIETIYPQLKTAECRIVYGRQRIINPKKHIYLPLGLFSNQLRRAERPLI